MDSTKHSMGVGGASTHSTRVSTCDWDRSPFSGMRTSHASHFVPLGVRSHVTPVGSLRTIALGNGCYRCGEIGYYVRDCHKAPIQFAKGGFKFNKGRLGRSPHSSHLALLYRCCYDCGKLCH
ncbi:hypothetical protein H5410_046044 [Solanum commersonii]|uniref:CCHC-type domain-containing protein n=1 Tax=Solanum commersonii TaxID=4109 RepID=A0A9J5XD12_SOLCO|nr:hypothetical protein H5410_046044 [Solanum commersonii]